MSETPLKRPLVRSDRYHQLQCQADLEADRKNDRLGRTVKNFVIGAGLVLVVAFVCWLGKTPADKPTLVSPTPQVTASASIAPSSASNKPQSKKGGEKDGPVDVYATGGTVELP